MPPRPLIDLSTIDPDQVLYPIEVIRESNPQRLEFEHPVDGRAVCLESPLPQELSDVMAELERHARRRQARA